MNLRNFSLIPFQREEDRPDLAIKGQVGCRAGLLSIRYALLGNMSDLAIPAPEETPGRKDRLWEGTCLELFLGAKGSEAYREFNLSPSGNWNVFRFTSYRAGMLEEEAFTSLPFAVRIGQDALELSLELDVGKILPKNEAIEAGVAVVVKTVKGGTSYWALAHPGPRPDFHRREGFALTIPCQATS